MDGLRSPDVCALLDFLDDVEGVSTEDDATFTTTILAGLGRLVRSDSVWWADCDYEHHRNRMLSSDRRVGPAYEALQERWWELYGQHPILSHRDRSGDYRALMLSDFAERRVLVRLELYDEFFHPFDIEYSLSIRIGIAPGHVVDLGLTRVGGDFSWRDRALLDLVRPTLGHVLRSRAATSSQLQDAGLSRREEEVLRLVADGLSNAAVASALFIAPGTVKKHLDNIYEKLDVANRTEAARLLGSPADLDRREDDARKGVQPPGP